MGRAYSVQRDAPLTDALRNAGPHQIAQEHVPHSLLIQFGCFGEAGDSDFAALQHQLAQDAHRAFARKDATQRVSKVALGMRRKADSAYYTWCSTSIVAKTLVK